MDIRVCTTCGIAKSLADFSWHDKAKGKRRTQCRPCRKAIDADRVVTYVGPQVCTKCHIEQPANSFHWRRRAKNIRHSRCIACEQANRVARHHPAAVPIKNLDAPHVCSACHIEQPLNEFSWRNQIKGTRQSRCRTCKAMYRLRHLQDIHVKDAAYYLANKEELKQASRDNYAKNTNQIKIRAARYAHENKRIVNAISSRRRARQKAVPINDLSAEQFEEIKAAFSYRCAYCPPTCKACRNHTHVLAQEHITPFARQGSNTLWNVVPACTHCNSSKGTGPVHKPVQPLLLTIALAKKKKA